MPESVWVSCIVMTISVRFHCEHDTARVRTDGITGMLNLLPLSPQVPQDIRPDILSLQSYPVRVLQSSRAFPAQVNRVSPTLHSLFLARDPCV